MIRKNIPIAMSFFHGLPGILLQSDSSPQLLGAAVVFASVAFDLPVHDLVSVGRSACNHQWDFERDCVDAISKGSIRQSVVDHDIPLLELFEFAVDMLKNGIGFE